MARCQGDQGDLEPSRGDGEVDSCDVSWGTASAAGSGVGTSSWEGSRLASDSEDTTVTIRVTITQRPAVGRCQRASASHGHVMVAVPR